MKIDSLRLFVDVMRHGNFADVARDHGLAPSSVSRAIASLERELGTRLFQRSTRKVAPTEAAAKFYHRIYPAIREIEAAGEAARDSVSGISGTLRISAPAAFANSMIVPLLPDFAASHPELALDLQISDRFVDLVEERIDVAVRLGSLQDSSLISRKLADLQFYVCASPAYLSRHGEPRRPAELGDHECLLFPRSGYDLDWLFRDGSGSVERVAISGRYQITNSAAILSCAISGMGIALLPDWLLREHFAAGSLRPLFPDFRVTATDFDSAVWLLYPSRAYLPQKTRAFIDFLGDNFAREAT